MANIDSHNERRSFTRWELGLEPRLPGIPVTDAIDAARIIQNFYNRYKVAKEMLAKAPAYGAFDPAKRVLIRVDFTDRFDKFFLAYPEVACEGDLLAIAEGADGERWEVALHHASLSAIKYYLNTRDKDEIIPFCFFPGDLQWCAYLTAMLPSEQIGVFLAGDFTTVRAD